MSTMFRPASRQASKQGSTLLRQYAAAAMYPFMNPGESIFDQGPPLPSPMAHTFAQTRGSSQSRESTTIDLNLPPAPPVAANSFMTPSNSSMLEGLKRVTSKKAVPRSEQMKKGLGAAAPKLVLPTPSGP